MALSITRPKHRSLTNPSLIHLFSTSSSQNDNASLSPPSQEQQQQQQQQQQTSFSSYFSDVKASLKQQQQDPQSQNKPNFPPLRTPASISKPTSKIASLEEIKKNLAEYRLRSSVPPPTESSSFNTTFSDQQQRQTQHISFQDLYKRNMIGKSENFSGSDNGSNKSNKPASGRFSMDAIRESLRQMKSNANTKIDGSRRNDGDAMSFSGSRSSLKLSKEIESLKSSVVGGSGGMPSLVSVNKQRNVQGGMSTEFRKAYSYGELGEKLMSLRSEVKEGEKGWFSLEELNERLRKLREIEEKEYESRIGGYYSGIRESLIKLKDEKAEKSSIPIQRLNLFSTTPDFMQYPPKEHLVEKYFHPDNMSSAEKMKIGLSKVREEFKMSESDCGSARVQVAQLTTKIKHLSSVLHKKDKHSRKGLQEMVQKRKKLLKYLRRTDWDSYCFVLSKLGLRDNPDFKYLAKN
ncbi:uncharacterized protein LOC8283083 [Ricinus communis]|uniref:Small ribosomal subunit protein uS15c n=1 Tax=Ricinus communis TaxID=3988 RepID=B9SWS4_RICCO|nr:uncharacterized protein LOC8283083 [Ricinus communis]EEF31913.1 structural constituent of ribosome, putative [Ricinus communis]|eukprot:XP_002530443.1 uncharacterized protein LOC8283083 [Ricinus communis]